MRNLLLFTFCLLACFRSADAQLLGSFSLESGYSDNMFNSALRTPDASNDLTLMLGFFPDQQNWAINYTAALSTFANLPERLYSIHTIAGSYWLPYGSDENNSIAVLGNLSMRADREAYTVYDYRQALLSISAKHYFLPQLLAQTSWQSRYRNYQNFGELGYLEHVASLGGTTFLESRTSIRLQAELGIKSYEAAQPDNALDIATLSGDPSLSGMSKVGSSINGGGNGNGRDPGNMNGGGWGQRRIGMGGATTNPDLTYLVYEEASTRQLRLWANIGQSLGESTGLRLRYQQRLNLNSRGRAFVGGAVERIGEEELFDDPYSYESSEATLTITQLLPWNMRAQASVFSFVKSYSYAAFIDEEGNGGGARADHRYGGWIQLQKPIVGEWLIFRGLDLSLHYMYLRNESNSPWYDYFSNTVGLGLSTDF